MTVVSLESRITFEQSKYEVIDHRSHEAIFWPVQPTQARLNFRLVCIGREKLDSTSRMMCAVAALLPHLERGIGYVVLLLFPALILTVARQVGKSVRATIPIHAIYNLTGSFPLIELFLKLFQN